MKQKTGTRRWKGMASIALTIALITQSLVFPAMAGDTWPFAGDSAQGPNQPSVHGFTSGQILNWSPETDPNSALLRSFVPMQTRIGAFAATQANPALNPSVEYFNLAGDYGNAFIENAPYTNKFAQYHFNNWQYIDYYSYWHGTATAYTPPSYYDELGQKDWQQKWFEFGCLNIPNPTYTDAAHKNGVKSLACIFFSNNDRGQQTYKQMLVKNADGSFPIANKMVEMANYFGYDGYFFNQEEASPDVAPADIPDYVAFLKVFQNAGLYVQWYDSVNISTGANSFARQLTASNGGWLYDTAAKQPVTNSFFFDYGVSSGQVNASNTFLSSLNAANGTAYTIFQTCFAGLEAGRDRFKSAQGSAISSKLDANGVPGMSIAVLGTDFVHAGLDEDMGQNWPVRHRNENDYQWMTTVRDRLWWSGPNMNPKNTTKASTNSVDDVYADNRYWPGVASFMAERSVIGGNGFTTNFNTGHGLSTYCNGTVSNDEEWSNLSLEDVPVTWQWWQDTSGTRLDVDYDYGSKYTMTGNKYNRFAYQKIGGYNGGSSLVVDGTLDAENFLRLYKTALAVNASTKLSLTYNKPSASDSSTMSLGLVFQDDPANVVKVPVTDAGLKTSGWATATLDLSAYAGKTIAAFGLVFNKTGDTIANYQMNIGQIRITDGSATKPAAPANLKIRNLYANSSEMTLEWDRQDYSLVKQYNVYVNNVYVGGKYDSLFYIKKLPARSGTVKVVPVGADGLEGDAATVSFSLTDSVSGLAADARTDGTFTVSWTNPAAHVQAQSPLMAAAAGGDAVSGAGADETASASGPSTTTAAFSADSLTHGGIALADPAPSGIKVKIRTLNRKASDTVTREMTVAPGESSATFTGMPVNGDDYVVEVSIGAQQPVSLGGRLCDAVCEPYAEAWSWNGTTLSLPMPNTRDWRYLYVYEDGVAKQFATTYSVGNRPMIIRGRSTKACLSFASTASTVYVVMEDYAGNRSPKVFLKTTPITESHFPDPILRQWVADHVGSSIGDVSDFTGTLDLSGLAMTNPAGLSLFRNATGVKLCGTNITTLDRGMLPPNATKVDLSGITTLAYIREGAFTGMSLLKSLDITGCTALRLLSLKGSAIDSLTYGSRAAFPQLIALDFTGTPLDMRVGTSARTFAEQVRTQVVSGQAISFPETMVISTTGEGGPVVTSGGITNTASLFDGLTSGTYGYAAANTGASITLDFQKVREFRGLRFYGTSSTYTPHNFEIATSSDGTTYTTVGSAVSGNTTTTYETTFASPITARFFRFSLQSYTYAQRMYELQVIGQGEVLYPSSVKFAGADVLAIRNLSPATGVYNIPAQDPLVITFPDAIARGLGNITIRNAADDSIFQVIPANSSLLTLSGATVVIGHNRFPSGNKYYVQVDAGTFRDTAGVSCAGVSAKTDWAFSTVKNTLKIDLGAFCNLDVISSDLKRDDGDIDGYGSSFPAEQLVAAQPVSAGGITFQLGSMEPGVSNAIVCTGQSIDVPDAEYGLVGLLGASSGYSEQTGTAILNYADGTTSAAVAAVAGWSYGSLSKSILALSLPHSHEASGDINGAVRLSACFLTPAAGKVLASVTLPNSQNMKILAMSLQQISPTGIGLDLSKLNMTIGTSDARLQATVTPSNAANRRVLWSSTNPSVATVTDGLVKAAGTGTAVIYAITEDGGLVAACSVDVSPADQRIDPGQAHPDRGESIKTAILGGDASATAAFSASEMAQAVKSAAAGTIRLEAAGTERANSVQLSFPGNALSGISESVQSIELDTGLASVTIDTNLLREIVTDKTGDVSIQVTKADISSLTESQRREIGDNPVYDFTLMVGNDTISQFKPSSITVSFDYALKPGETAENIIVYFLDGSGALQVVTNGRYDTATGKVVFSPVHFSTYTCAHVNGSFTDVNGFGWAKTGINALHARKIINGTGKGTFSPARAITRGEFITMLMKAFTSMESGTACTFTDVPATSPYADAIALAQRWGIAHGRGNGTFGPNERITRQDMASMMYRLAEKLGIALASTCAPVHFSDAATFAPSSVQAISALQTAGILGGTGSDRFEPHKEATRAEAATVIYRMFAMRP